MASFTAELHVAGYVFRVHRGHYSIQQAADLRGRTTAKVRYEPVRLTLDVPDGNFLLAWAAAPHKRQAADLVFRDAAGGSALETLRLPAAYCTSYWEAFVAGDANGGSYVCYLVLSDPNGWTLQAGGPGAYLAPAARAHGVPPQLTGSPPAVPPIGTVSTCPPDVTARLQLQVELMCNSRGVSSRCTELDSCSSLLAKIAVAESCIRARRAIMTQCFEGGDQVHKDQVTNRERGVARCKAIFARQCGPAHEPVPVPSREPSTRPADDQHPSPVGPTTLAGAALLLLYIITSALRPGPI